jgi:hypothetical protein
MIKIRTDEKPSEIFKMQANEESLIAWAKTPNNTYIPKFKKTKIIKNSTWYLNFFKDLLLTNVQNLRP